MEYTWVKKNDGEYLYANGDGKIVGKVYNTHSGEWVATEDVRNLMFLSLGTYITEAHAKIALQKHFNEQETSKTKTLIKG